MTRILLTIGIGLGLVAASAKAAEVPRKAPELAIQLVDGQQLLLSQYRGKVVLLEFVHTTCPHCQHDSALVEQIYKELGPRGFQPLAVAFNDNAIALVPDFVRMIGITYPVGVATRDTVIDYLQYSYLQPLYVPQMIFIDRKGVIRAQHGGIDDDFLRTEIQQNIRNEVETLLKEPVHHSGSPASKSRAPAKPQS